jgi:hypothetical protein
VTLVDRGCPLPYDLIQARVACGSIPSFQLFTTFSVKEDDESVLRLPDLNVIRKILFHACYATESCEGSGGTPSHVHLGYSLLRRRRLKTLPRVMMS